MSTDAVSEKKGLLHELKDGFSIDLTEEEYLAKEAEIRKIADKLTINMDVLNLLEKDYKLRLLVLSIISYFGFREVTGEELLDAANLQPAEGINPMKFFFMKAGWAPYYLEYSFSKDYHVPFNEVMDTFYADVEFYMDMSEHLGYGKDSKRSEDCLNQKEAVTKCAIILPQPLLFCPSPVMEFPYV